jgi:FkbM family methyltransferase
MKKIQYYINRPEYIFQPSRIINKIALVYLNIHTEENYIKLPWGLDLNISSSPNDVIIRALKSYGVYDLSLTEVLWRLISPEDIVVDVGANIGYMTSIMASKVGQKGQVWCFEPNPEVYQELIENINSWEEICQCNCFVESTALSNYNGEATLNIPLKNRGEAFISNDDLMRKDIKKNFKVKIKRLDEVLPINSKIGVMKLDVEGYELPVLQGACQLLEKQNIRDIIFEEHRPYPSEVTDYLEGYGYKVFKIWKGFLKPFLLKPSNQSIHPWEPTNYLATTNTDRVFDLLEPIGWKSLQKK